MGIDPVKQASAFGTLKRRIAKELPHITHLAAKAATNWEPKSQVLTEQQRRQLARLIEEAWPVLWRYARHRALMYEGMVGCPHTDADEVLASALLVMARKFPSYDPRRGRRDGSVIDSFIRWAAWIIRSDHGHQIRHHMRHWSRSFYPGKWSWRRIEYIKQQAEAAKVFRAIEEPGGE